MLYSSAAISQHLRWLTGVFSTLMCCSSSSPRLCVTGEKKRNFIGGDGFPRLLQLVITSAASDVVSWSPEKWRWWYGGTSAPRRGFGRYSHMAKLVWSDCFLLFCCCCCCYLFATLRTLQFAHLCVHVPPITCGSFALSWLRGHWCALTRRFGAILVPFFRLPFFTKSYDASPACPQVDPFATCLFYVNFKPWQQSFQPIRAGDHHITTASVE